eukprot:GHVR01129954.1.p1 GENE.GHVR01129954.1~~GHVR01129954.1.p1  ORF type:complete len:396 (+),score=89.88 GHVR01129954.1:24-1211(+)
MSSADHQLFVQDKINPVLEPLVTQALLERPINVNAFMIKWLCERAKIDGPNTELSRLRKENNELKSQLDKAGIADVLSSSQLDPPEESQSDEDDVVEDLPVFNPVSRNKMRVSVSAEAYGAWNKKTLFTPPVHSKTDAQCGRLQGVLSNSFMFSALEAKDMNTVILAMQEKVLKPKERPINQGDDGDCLYVIESGKIECFKVFEPGTPEKMVKSLSAGDVFGELALLYNCPRAASVEAKETSVVWILDRGTFNAIVKESANKKRQLYQTFLKSVTLFDNLDDYERNKIADALKTDTFVNEEYIVRQGGVGDKFFLVESGEAIATKSFVPGQAPKQVMQYKRGDFFGELAILKNEPRAANIIAKGPCTCASLDRASFKRLLGPLQTILSRAEAQYE